MNKKRRNTKKGVGNNDLSASPSSSNNNQSIDCSTRCKFLLTNFLIAISGGIPGILGILTYFRHPTVRIHFDESHTIICRIAKSNDDNFNGCTALLLWGATIVGAEEEKFVAFEIDLSIRADDVWYEGKRFYPIQHDTANSDGTSSKELRFYVGVPDSITKQGATQGATTDLANGVKIGDTILVSDWKEFAPGVSVGFGEPQTFMIANYFPTAPKKHTTVDRIRIKVIDYLGNSYSEEFGTGRFKYAKIDFFLDESLA